MHWMGRRPDKPIYTSLDRAFDPAGRNVFPAAHCNEGVPPTLYMCLEWQSYDPCDGPFRKRLNYRDTNGYGAPLNGEGHWRVRILITQSPPVTGMIELGLASTSDSDASPYISTLECGMRVRSSFRPRSLRVVQSVSRHATPRSSVGME